MKSNERRERKTNKKNNSKNPLPCSCQNKLFALDLTAQNKNNSDANEITSGQI